MLALFPQRPLQVVPISNPVFRSHYRFPHGLPKIHQHDGKPATAWGIEMDGRIVVLSSIIAHGEKGPPNTVAARLPL